MSYNSRDASACQVVSSNPESQARLRLSGGAVKPADWNTFELVAALARNHPGLTGFKFKIMINLIGRLNPQRGHADVWPSQETIARDVGCSRIHVVNTITWLREQGYLTVRQDRSRAGKKNIYTVSIQKILDPSSTSLNVKSSLHSMYTPVYIKKEKKESMGTRALSGAVQTCQMDLITDSFLTKQGGSSYRSRRRAGK